MTDIELQIIMGALENHRRDVKSDLNEIKEEIAKQGLVVQAHQSRFEAFDTIRHAVFVVGSWLAAGITAVWAIVTFKFGGK